MRARVWGLAGGLVLLLAGLVWGQESNLPIAYVELKYSLVRSGLDRDFVFKTFADSRNQFLPQVVHRIAYLRKERAADYQQFLKPEVIARGRSYMKEHQRDLMRAEARYGVSRGVIVGILTVESGLGSITGKYSVFNVFASLAVMDTPEVMREADLSPHLRDRLRKKAAWAKRELKVFLEYCRSHRVDPFFFNGSWAGAMGFAQFLPSSLKSYGADGDGDGRVDLYNHADAIFSIASYLEGSGFKMDRQPTWRRAVLRYNHSDAYADTVLALAEWY